MESAIDILQQQYDWVLNNKDACPHSDDYYNGYAEGTKGCLDLLRQARQAKPHTPNTDPLEIPKVREI